MFYRAVSSCCIGMLLQMCSPNISRKNNRQLMSRVVCIYTVCVFTIMYIVLRHKQWSVEPSAEQLHERLFSTGRLQ